jgi:hypothetical protein
MLKTKVRSKVQSKAKDKVKSKITLPVATYSRLQVLLDAFKSKSIKMDKTIELAKLKIGKKLFGEIISSRPVIGSTTRKGLAVAGITCEAITKLPNKNLWSVVKFHKGKR